MVNEDDSDHFDRPTVATQDGLLRSTVAGLIDAVRTGKNCSSLP